MHNPTEYLARILEVLTNEPSYYSVYLFPIFVTLVGSLTGYIVAIKIAEFQHTSTETKENLWAANRWTLAFLDRYRELEDIKKSYANQLSDDPYQRMNIINEFLNLPEIISEDLLSISFVLKARAIETQSHEDWSNLENTAGLVRSYNNLSRMWKKRNELNPGIRDKIQTRINGLEGAKFDPNELPDIVGVTELRTFIHLTESVISETDRTMNKIVMFLEKFPQLAVSVLDEKMVKKFGGVNIFKFDSKDILDEETKVDIAKLATILGCPAKALKHLQR